MIPQFQPTRLLTTVFGILGFFASEDLHLNSSDSYVDYVCPLLLNVASSEKSKFSTKTGFPWI